MRMTSDTKPSRQATVNVMSRLATIPFFLTILITASTLTSHASAQEDSTPPPVGSYAGVISPNDVLALAMTELMEKQSLYTRNQRAIMQKYMPFVAPDINTMPENPVDQFALGNLLFLSLMAVDSEAHLEDLMEREDVIGRISWQRVMQIRRRAYDRPEETREMLDEYIAKYAPSSIEINGRSKQLAVYISNYFENGDADQAVNLLLEELKRMPTNAPYPSFLLPVTVTEQIQKSGRSNEIYSLIEQKLADLKSLENEWTAKTPSFEEDLAIRKQAPTWYWISEGVSSEKSVHEVRLQQLRSMIHDLDAWLARRN
ncbi:hypothetical protein [Kordiimonas aquimaris]|uniref:hypothetical protein n=1 Tax=Kordiimonas aquimaris TaxID=707591 RepID=UPI0021D33172|nr:hypothetical protein [Kordiimonas aquimaris]